MQKSVGQFCFYCYFVSDPLFWWNLISTNFWDTNVEWCGIAACIEHGLLFPGIPHTSLLILLDDLSENMRNRSNGKKTRKGNRIRNRGYELEEMAYLNDFEFKRVFRMSRIVFNKLLRLVENEFTNETECYAEYSSGSPITSKTRLAVTLRWLAGGSYIDKCFEFGVARVTKMGKISSGSVQDQFKISLRSVAILSILPLDSGHLKFSWNAFPASWL